jgi:GT2 family glycosyltransferase
MNRLRDLEQAVASAHGELAGVCDYEIVIIDGQSTDGTAEFLAGQPNLMHIVEQERRGHVNAFASGFAAARGQWIAWGNDDAVFSPGCFANMLGWLGHEANANVGMAAFPTSESREAIHRYVFNCCLEYPVPYANFGMLRRDVYERVGGPDLAYRAYAWDPDLSLRIWKAGYVVAPCPDAFVIHYFAEGELRTNGESHMNADTRLLLDRHSPDAARLAAHIWSDDAYFAAARPFLQPHDLAMASVVRGELDDLERTLGGMDWSAPASGRMVAPLYYGALALLDRGEETRARHLLADIAGLEAARPAIRAWALYKQSQLLRRDRDMDGADALCRRALALHPSLAKARIDLAPAALSVSLGPLPQAAPAGHEPVTVDFDWTDEALWSYYFDGRTLGLLHVHAPVDSDQAQTLARAAAPYLDPSARVVLAGPAAPAAAAFSAITGAVVTTEDRP